MVFGNEKPIYVLDTNLQNFISQKKLTLTGAEECSPSHTVPKWQSTISYLGL